MSGPRRERERTIPAPRHERAIPAARHEHRDIGERFIWGAVAVMGALLLGCGLLTLWMYPKSRLDRVIELPPAPYPAPRLQTNSQADFAAFQAGEMRVLEGRGWDAAYHTAHIPIEEAMRKVAEEGIAGWPEPAEQAP